MIWLRNLTANCANIKYKNLINKILYLTVDKRVSHKYNIVCRQVTVYADVAELADALDLGSSVDDVGVQVPSSAPIGKEGLQR